MASLAADLSGGETEVILVGGMGNQLFGYAVGNFLEQVWGHRVVYNTWHIPRGVTNHGVSIEGRTLEGDFRSVPPSPSWKKLFLKRFGSRGTGWDPKLSSVRKGTKVSGYFQTWKYVDAISSTVFSRDRLIPSAGPSTWLKENIDLACSAKPFILHFRRGDYKTMPKTMGLLARDYYLQALRKLEEQGENPAVWIFSDEPQLAGRFFRDLGDTFRIISPPAKTDPGESMVLMTYGHGHIISNSTFSWWGAYLSPTSKVVIAPNPWFPGRDAPQDLFPKNWLLLDHNWGAA